MKKTTLYLPDELKHQLELVARKQARSEASIIRDAVAAAVRTGAPRPRVPLSNKGLGDATVAAHVDDKLDGFGQ